MHFPTVTLADFLLEQKQQHHQHDAAQRPLLVFKLAAAGASVPETQQPMLLCRHQQHQQQQLLPIKQSGCRCDRLHSCSIQQYTYNALQIFCKQKVPAKSMNARLRWRITT